MKNILIALCLTIPAFCFSQLNINKTGAEIKKELQLLRNEKTTVKVSIKETDSTVLATVTKKGNDSYSHFFALDKEDSCKLEKITFTCDTCFTKKLEAILEIENYGWKKINENQYVSRFEDYRMIELPVNNKSFTISILRMEWSQLLYDVLMGNK
jgi:hypothetical protein